MNKTIQTIQGFSLRDCGCVWLEVFATVNDLIHSSRFTWRKPPWPAVCPSPAHSSLCWTRRSRLTVRAPLAVPVWSHRYSPVKTTYSSYRERKNTHICLLTETDARNRRKHHQIKAVLMCMGETWVWIPRKKWFSLLISGDKMQTKEGKQQ